MLGPFIAAVVVRNSSFLQFEQRSVHRVSVRVRIRHERLDLFRPPGKLIESPPICHLRIACRHHASLDETNREKVRFSSNLGISYCSEQLWCVSRLPEIRHVRNFAGNCCQAG